MNAETLTELGLTLPQAKAYIHLIKAGQMTPPQIATATKETRTNAYKILERLEELGLVRKDETIKKLAYRPENPVALENLATKARSQVIEHEKQVKNAMPSLLNYFFTYSEQPGVRFYQGEDGIKQIFNDMLRTSQPIYLVRSPADVSFYNQAFFEKFREKRAKLGIETYALTPNVASAVHDPATDTINRFSRTWIPADAYTANVEWDVYGDKLAIISYGQEAIGMIIESPQIADSFKQLFYLLRSVTPDK